MIQQLLNCLGQKIGNMSDQIMAAGQGLDIPNKIDLSPETMSIDLQLKDVDDIKEEVSDLYITDNIKIDCQTSDQGSDKHEIFGQNKENSVTRFENVHKMDKPRAISQKEIDINLMDYDCEFDAFTDNNSIYRKYKLRDKRKLEKPLIGEPENVTLNLRKISKLKNKPKDDIKDNFVCPHCYIDCKNKTGISAHIKIHKRATTFTCLQCSAKFNSNTKLIIHKNEHIQEKQSYTCKKCKLAFSDHCDYLLHEMTHKNGIKYNCNECQLVCNTRYGYQIHIQTHFDRKVKCHVCSKMIQGYTFQKHLKEHNTSTYLECEECGKLCKNKHDLSYHMASHTGVKLFQCLYCGKGFINSGQRMVHTRIHTGERPFECTTCYEKFKQQTDLKRHMVTHDTVPKHQCDICKKTFFHKDYLDGVHMRKHMNKLDYECKECGKRFYNSGGLKKHTLFKHTTEKKFKCKPCKISFFLNSHYVRHCRTKRHINIMYGETMKATSNQNE